MKGKLRQLYLASRAKQPKLKMPNSKHTALRAAANQILAHVAQDKKALGFESSSSTPDKQGMHMFASPNEIISTDKGTSARHTALKPLRVAAGSKIDQSKRKMLLL